NTGSNGLSASSSTPCGTFNSSTMIVMMIAITPSLNASSRFFCTRRGLAGTHPFRNRLSFRLLVQGHRLWNRTPLRRKQTKVRCPQNQQPDNQKLDPPHSQEIKRTTPFV